MLLLLLDSSGVIVPEASVISTVMTQIVTALSASMVGTGLDLSVAGKVKRGRYADPPAGFDAFIGVCSPEVASEQGPTIRQYLRTLTIQIDSWASLEQETTEHRAIRGELLMDDILTVLEAARVNPTYAGGLYDCRDFVASGVNLEGDFDPTPRGYARSVITLVLSYAVDQGL